MSKAGWAVVVVLVVAIVGGAWWYMTRNTNPGGLPVAPGVQAVPSPTGPANETGSNVPANSDAGQPDTGVQGAAGASVSVSAAPMTATVTYNNDSGFSPKSVSIAKGGTVTFKDEGGAPMWVASDEHPSHTEYDGTSRTAHCAAGYAGEKPFDQCGTGTTYSFTFTKAGSFQFHNHAAAQFSGMVVVQ